MNRTAYMLGLAMILMVSCAKPPKERMPCPSLEGAAALAAGASEVLEFDAVVDTQLRPIGYGSHLFMAPENSTVTVRLTYKDPAIRPVLFLYGPRGKEGGFAQCLDETAQPAAGETAVLELAVTAENAGEYRALVTTFPHRLSQESYEIVATCEGEGCKSQQCEALVDCPIIDCPNGFVLDDNDCKTCACVPVDCGPFKTFIDGECHCNCEPDGKPVCGTNGVTYPNACLAGCQAVQIAFSGPCEVQCPLNVPEDCPAVCANGYQSINGCLTCECNGTPCDAVPATYEPVCGADGFTYRNRQQAECDGTTVDYLGPCLPHCQRPLDCDIQCDYGLKPRPGLGKNCFHCECMPEPTKEEFWCARAALTFERAPDGMGTGNTGTGGTATAFDGYLDSLDPHARQLATRINRTRTFPSAEVAKNMSWVPVVRGACPGTGCLGDDDCASAVVAVEAMMDAVSGPSFQPVDALTGWQLQCTGNTKKRVGVCELTTPPTCVGTGIAQPGNMPSNADQLVCLDSEVCVHSPVGPLCRPADNCECLTKDSSHIYDPVCAPLNGGQYEFFNACYAFCAGAWPIAYPGACCGSQAKSSEQTLKAYAYLQGYCDGETSTSVHYNLGNACPALPDQCEDSQGGVSSICCLPPPPEDI